MMAIGVGVLALILYLATLSGHYSADSILLALQVEHGQLDSILDPTHLLLQPLAYAWYQLWRTFGLSDGSLMPLQIINAAGGAAAVGLLFSIVRSITASKRLAWLTASGFAVSGGLWLLSVEAEFVTIPLAINLLVLWLLLAAPEGVMAWRGYGFLLGGVIALAILSYLSGIFLLLVAGAALLLQENVSRRIRLRRLAEMVLASLLICLPVATGLLSYRSWPEWAATIWQDGGSGYAAFGWFDAPHGVYAFLRTLGLFPGQALNDSGWEFLRAASAGEQILFSIYYGVVLLVAMAPFLLAWPVRGRIWQRFRFEFIVILLWAVLYTAFAVYWVPGDISFWLPSLSGWWLLMALSLSVRYGTLSAGRQLAGGTRRFARPDTVLLFGLIVFLAIVNGSLSILPRHDLASNDDYLLAMKARQNTSTKDLIVTASDDIAALYLVYFGERSVLPAAELLSGEDESGGVFMELFEDTRSRSGRILLLRDRELVFLAP